MFFIILKACNDAIDLQVKLNREGTYSKVYLDTLMEAKVLIVKLMQFN